MDINWLKLHPKLQKLVIVLVPLLLGSAIAVLNKTISFNDAAIADVTAVLSAVIVYFSPSK